MSARKLTFALTSLSVAILTGELLGQQGEQPSAPKVTLIQAETLFTMVGPPIKDGFIMIRGDKIESVGSPNQMPKDLPITKVKVVTPGFIDAHSVVGLTGVLNIPHDQDQLEQSSPMQPELRALDAYHPKDPLVEWVRSLGVTTLHTGHGPGALISGQTMIIKTHGRSDAQAVVKPVAMVAVTLADSGRSRTGKAPGPRDKSVAMLREKLLEARAYAAKKKRDADAATDLGLETMAKVLSGEVPLLITAHRACAVW